MAPSLFYGLDSALRLVASDSKLNVFCLSESTDSGDSWAPAVPTPLPNLGRGIGMATLKDGRLTAVYNDAKTAKQKRSNSHQVVLALSKDDGKTWHKSVLLETHHGEFGSPVVFQGQDQILHVFYNWKRKNIKHVAIDPFQLMAGSHH